MTETRPQPKGVAVGLRAPAGRRAGRATPQARSAPATGLSDLEAMQRFASGPVPFAFFDAPWTPVFLFALSFFHWMLGLLAVFSGLSLFALALMTQARTARLQAAGAASACAAPPWSASPQSGAMRSVPPSRSRTGAGPSRSSRARSGCSSSR